MIDFDVTQNPANISVSEFSPTFPPIDTEAVQQAAYGFIGVLNNYILMTVEADGIYITEGDKSGWDESTRIVIATPQVGEPNKVITNISLVNDVNGDWVAFWSFDLPDTEEPECFFFKKGDPIETSIGAGKAFIGVIQHIYSITEKFMYYVRGGILYVRSSTDNFTTETNAQPTLQNINTFKLFIATNYKFQLQIFGASLV